MDAAARRSGGHPVHSPPGWKASSSTGCWSARSEQRCAEPLTVAAIAAARMSVASLHRNFKAVTGMSPLQFQKALRLQQAHRLLMAGAGTAAGVASMVG